MAIVDMDLWSRWTKKTLFDLEVKGQGLMKVIMVRDTPSYGHAPHTKYHWPISKDKKCYGQDKKILFKNNYLTFMSKVKVQRRSLRYATHRLMDKHPHTKYHWLISKETIIWPRGQRTRSHESHYGTWHTALWTCTHIPNIIDLSQKKQLFDPKVKVQ